MQMRIIELEDELAQQPSTKRARTSIASSAPDESESTPAASTGPSTASIKMDEKKRKMQVKRIFDRLRIFISFCLSLLNRSFVQPFLG
jgi:hypothetical protein